ncbi:hypothetical protein D3C73_1134560 [compost metagenome]
MALGGDQRVDAFGMQRAAVGPAFQGGVGIGHGLVGAVQVRQRFNADAAPFQPVRVQ